MLLITVLVIVSFVWLFNAPQFEQASELSVARIYGRDVSATQIEKDERMLRLALALGLSDFATTLEGTNFSQAGAVDFVLNTMIIRHEGKELGIIPTDKQVEDAIKKLPTFQTNGAFDPNKYQMFVQNALAPRGFVPKHVDDLIRDTIILDEITKVIDAAPTATEPEIAALNRAFQPATGQAVIFSRADFVPKAKVTDEEVDALYTVATSRFITPEWRSAKYVRFQLPADAASLEGPAKIEAQQRLGDEASKFSEDAAVNGFDKAAADAGYKIEVTLPFDRQGTVKDLAGLEGNLAALRGPAAALAPTLFTLTETSPVSGVIVDGNDFLVAQLDETTPARQLSLEEARPLIVPELTAIAAQNLLEETAAETLEKLRAGLKDGKSFADLVAEAGLKTASFTNVAPLDEAATEEQRQMADATTSLRDGEISGVLPHPDGGMFVWLEKRSDADPAQLAERHEQIEAYILSRKRSILFYEWLMWAREKAELQFPGQQG